MRNRSKRRLALGVAAACVALVATACGGGGGAGTTSGGGAEFNAALTNVVNPSDAKGGTIRVANSGEWDSTDPGDTYYGFSWNFIRLYSRSLMMFKSAPGSGSNELVPDLAESAGVSSDSGKTWTYKIRKGVKYEDGTEVKAADVKYAVLRTVDKTVLAHGPSYFSGMLAFPSAYKGPYKTPDVNTDSAIETPDDYTVVFHLKAPFAGFDYLAMLSQTAPVQKAKDTGSKYKNEIVSTGPYKFQDMQPDKGFNLVRNDQWDASTDPNRKALPDKYEVSLKVDANDVDNRLLSGDLDIDLAGTGAQSAAQTRILQDPTLKAGADNPLISRLWYTSIVPTVAPFDNIECRKAVLYAMDQTSYQTAYGGAFSGGELATTLLPPQIPGYSKFDLYPNGQDHKGDLTAAKDALTKCGQPNGFATNIAYRAERPKEKATAEAFQQALSKVGIQLTLKPYPQGSYFDSYAGNPEFVVKNKLGLDVNGWGADWNDGFGFLSQVVDSRVIVPTGGSSNISVRIPEVDTMLDAALQQLDTDKRNAEWGAIDKRVMEEAVIYPGVYAKSLLIRPKKVTNVFVSDAFGMYDYLAMGVQQ